jgi:outer membrane protein TolC
MLKSMRNPETGYPRLRRAAIVATLLVQSLLFLMAGRTAAQANEPVPSEQITTTAEQGSQPDSAAASPPAITFSEALKRATANNPQLQAAFTALGLAHQDLVQSRAALLPNVSYNMQDISNQTNHLTTVPPTPPSPIFIANNGAHEYIAQGNVHETLSLQTFADYRRSAGAQAVAKAKSEIALRGLAVTVSQAYYGYIAAQHKYATAQRAGEEAQRFFGISDKLEKGGEVAHSDVIKAELQYRQQQRDLREAQLGLNKSRLDLAVLIFKDFTESFEVVDDLGSPQPLPTFEEVSAAGTRNNPDLRAAQATLRQAGDAVTSAWGGVLPTLSFDYWYGIDAAQFATKTPDGLNNLGSSAAATLQLPIWSWGANYSKVKQANLQKKQAVVELSAAQRTLLANLHNFYNEAEAARSELELLSHSAQLASESLRLTSLRYQSGEATVLEVVDAQNTLTAASNAYDDGQVRFRVALANIQTLTGKF